MKQTHVLILFLVVLTFAGGFLASAAFATASAAGAAGRFPDAPTRAGDPEVIILLGEIRAELVRLNEALGRRRRRARRRSAGPSPIRAATAPWCCAR
jgi:hypothetical protein